MARLAGITIVVLAVVVPSVSARSSAHIVAISDPAWSPTRAEIAFDARFDDGSSAVVVMAANGSHVRRLTQVGRTPVWSPDGNLLAVVGFDGRGNVLRVVKRDGTLMVAGWGATIVEPESRWHSASWAPDSDRLTFDHEDPTNSPDGIVTVSVADSYASPDSLDFYGYAPAWSPRRGLVAYSIPHCGAKFAWNGDCGRSSHAEAAVLYVNAPSGRRRRRLFGGENAAWSSDGNLLAFAAPGGIYVARPNGKERRLLFRTFVEPAGESMQPVWAPHRPLIAVCDHNATFVIDVPRRVVRRVSRGGAGKPSWSSDGRRLVFAAGARLYVTDANGKRGHYVMPAAVNG